jgi:hypothetical protein
VEVECGKWQIRGGGMECETDNEEERMVGE